MIYYLIKIYLLLCFSINLQNVPASGVPTGFPSKRIVLIALNKGAYVMKECPKTHPISLEQKSPSFGLRS